MTELVNLDVEQYGRVHGVITNVDKWGEEKTVIGHLKVKKQRVQHNNWIHLWYLDDEVIYDATR